MLIALHLVQPRHILLAHVVVIRIQRVPLAMSVLRVRMRFKLARVFLRAPTGCVHYAHPFVQPDNRFKELVHRHQALNVSLV